MVPQPMSLPDRLGSDQHDESVRIGHDVPRLEPYRAQFLREQPGAAEHLHEERDDQHPAEEMRQVDDALDETAQRLEITLLSSSASAIGSGKKNTNWKAVIARVLRSASQKAGSRNRASKLPKPIHSL